MEPIVVRSGEGTVYRRPRTQGVVTVKLSSGAATLFETARATGDDQGPGIHSHAAFEETFYVVAGEWEFVVGERTVVVDAGSVVHIPPGVFHAFRSTGRLDGKLVGVAVPGGIEHFFEEGDRAAEREQAASRSVTPGQ